MLEELVRLHMTHFLRDILRQPEELERTIEYLCRPRLPALVAAADAVRGARHVYLTGIGSSWHAALNVSTLFHQHAYPVYVQDAAELLSRVKKSSASFFEHLVVELLLKMGYGGSLKEAGNAIGRSGDEGIDGIIKEDRLGLDAIYLQAKKWEGTVGRPEIQKFVGALHGKRAKKGVFITTGTFSSEAVDYVGNIDPKVVLIDGRQLTEFMIDFGIGVTESSTYHVKRIDSDYFGEE